MFSFFRKKPPQAASVHTNDSAKSEDIDAQHRRDGSVPQQGVLDAPRSAQATESTHFVRHNEQTALDASQQHHAATAPKSAWLARLRAGLKRTGQGFRAALSLTTIDETLYEELESALLSADTGYGAAQFVLSTLRARVRHGAVTDPGAIKAILTEILTELLTPLEKELVIGQHTPTVIMVAGVNGAGKTTSIGKLTRHFSDAGMGVLLAAADTFRAAAKEQLLSWADRNQVDIISQQSGDPAAVSFDAVTAGKARGRDVVIIDTAGRLSTQSHLMQELQKIKRVIQKADAHAPHEVLLVIDGNTGQNALTQVKAFNEAIALTGLIITKLDGTAKGGVLAAIALYNQERSKAGLPSVPVYFIGVGEQLEDLQQFKASEFAQAMIY